MESPQVTQARAPTTAEEGQGKPRAEPGKGGGRRGLLGACGVQGGGLAQSGGHGEDTQHERKTEPPLPFKLPFHCPHNVL